MSQLKKRNADPAHKACLEAFALDKAAADAHIQLAVQYRLNDLHQISGVVLAVTVHLYSNIITIGAGIAITALHAAANAKVDRQIQKRVAMLRQQFSRAVGGTIVDDQKVNLRAGGTQAFHGADDVGFLIITGNDNKNFGWVIQKGTSHQGNGRFGIKRGLPK